MALETRRGFLGAGAAWASVRGGAPAVQRRRPPNILLLLAAGHRYDWLGNARGPGVRTPNLAALAAEGLRFTRAVTPSPLAGPARACLASGREYPRCGVRGNDADYPLEQPTFFQALKEAGYHVMGCGVLDLHKATPDWGIDGRRFLPEWGFSDGIDVAGKLEAVASGAREARDPYMAFLHRRGLAQMHVDDYRRRARSAAYTHTEPTPLPEEAYCDNWIAANGLDLLHAAPAAKPWFLMLGFAGARSPLDITRRMERLCRDRKPPPPVDSDQYTTAKHLAIRQNYTAIVENIDRLTGVYLEDLRRHGALDHTVIFYSADKGEMLGDHNLWGAGVPYRTSAGIPLLAAGPGMEHGVVSNALVCLHDLAATILDYAGAPRLRDADSRSLRPLIEGQAETHRETVRSALGGWRMVFDGRYKLIRGFDFNPPAGGKARGDPLPLVLYDLKLDPEEKVNLVREAPGIVERLSKLLG